jgi:hypothetical protein
MTTRCKFVCQSIKKYNHWGDKGKFLYDAEFSAVTDGSDENKKFFAATPCGSLHVSTVAQDVFEVGTRYCRIPTTVTWSTMTKTSWAGTVFGIRPSTT